jgi:hypothetical protein
MKLLVALFVLALSPVAATPLPPEVQSFVLDREACDHFRGEPTEGDTPGQIERRAFVEESLEIHCAGTDRRLAALKRRYADNVSVMAILGQYEAAIEG